MAHIYRIFLSKCFFFTYLKRTGKTQIFTTLLAFKIFPMLWVIAKWTRTKGIIYTFLALIGLFCSVIFVDVLTVKLQTQPLVYLNQIQQIYSKVGTTTNLLIVLRGVMLHISMSLCSYVLYPEWHDIPRKGRITNK